MEYLFLTKEEQKVEKALQKRDAGLNLSHVRYSDGREVYLITDDDGGFEVATFEQVKQVAEFGSVLQ